MHGNDDIGIGRRRLPSLRRVGEMVQIRHPERDRLVRTLAKAQDISDLARLARQRLPAPIFDFIEGGAGDESAILRNRAAFADARFVPRVLRDVSAVDTATELFGERLSIPLVLAPVGMTRIANRGGEIAAARAAGDAGVPYTLSTMASTSPEDLALHAPHTRRWFQLYLWRDREASRALIERARGSGCTTLVLTVDVPVAGARLRDARHGLTMPPSISLRSAMQIARHPRWWIDAITLDPIDFAVVRTARAAFEAQVGGILDPSADISDLRWIRDLWDGPILVKGILSAADASIVRAEGVDGVVVSNHGGRQLGAAVAPLAVLPGIRSAVGNDAIVLVDGGVRSGSDIAVALASGADAVMIGRAYLYGLAAGGVAGVARAIELLRADTERTMALLGAASVSKLEHAMLLSHSPASNLHDELLASASFSSGERSK